MVNKKISELPYIEGSKLSGNTLVPLVTYFSATTGDTVHTYIMQPMDYLLVLKPVVPQLYLMLVKNMKVKSQ